MSEDSGVMSPTEVTCMCCGRRTDRVQSIEVPVVLFVVLYIVWTHEEVVGCPKCVRRRLWQLFWLSLPGSNVFFPVIGPLILLGLHRSYRRDRPGIPERFADWEKVEPFTPEPPSRGNWLHTCIAVVILLAVVYFVFFVVPQFAK